MPTQLSVTLRGMRFHTLVGILPHERQIAQPLEADVIARVDAQAGVSALDYRELYRITAAAAARGTGYLETLADELASDILALGGVAEVEIVLRKPHVPLPGPLEYAEVRLTRSRPGADTPAAPCDRSADSQDAPDA